MDGITPDTDGRDRYTDRPVVSSQRGDVTYDQLQGRVYVYEADQGHCSRADGRQLLSQGLGRVQVRFEENAQPDGVLYVPGLQANLLSIGQLAERGITCLFSSQGVYLRRDGKIL